MTNPPQSQNGDGQQEADRQADAMKAQLRKDVDSWSRARRELSTGRVDEPHASIARKQPALPASKARKLGTLPPRIKEAVTPKKPVSMSYNGVTTAEYLQYMLDRRSR